MSSTSSTPPPALRLLEKRARVRQRPQTPPRPLAWWARCLAWVAPVRRWPRAFVGPGTALVQGAWE